MGRRSRRFLGRRTCRHRCGTGEEGIGLLEVVVAFAVLMAVLVPTAIILQTATTEASTARQRLTALSLAEQCVEKLANTGPPVADGVPETGTAISENTHCIGSTPVVESTMTYTVHAEFTWTTAEGTHPDLCTSGSVPSVLALHVWVTWRRTQRIDDATIIDYPPPGLPTDGFLAVQVNGDPPGSPPADATGVAWATRVQRVPVTLTTTGYVATLHPDSYGCVFQQVPPGTYTVSLADPQSGGVPATPSWTANADETTSPSQSSLVVNVGLVTLATFQYDEGSFVSLSYPTSSATDGGVSCPAAGSIRCIVFGQAPASAADPGATPVAQLSVRTTSGWTVARPQGAVRLVAAACAGTVRCVVVGYGKSGSSYAGAITTTPISSGTPIAFTPSTVPSGVSTLSAVVCPSSTTCYATGSGSNGAVILSGTLSTSSASWVSDSLPSGVARITDLACPATSTCYATTSRGGVLSLSSKTTWVADTVPATATDAPSALEAISCTSTTSCYAVGTRKSSGASELSLTPLLPTNWVQDTAPTTLVSLSGLVCRPASSGVSCYADGSRTTGGSSYGAIASLSSPTTWQLDAPSGEGSIRALTCPSATACAAIATTTSGTPALLWSTGTSTFTSEPLPADVARVAGLTCPGTTQCFAWGTASSASGATAAIVSGAAATWNLDTLPESPVTISQIACGGGSCEAPGASVSGATFLEGTPTSTSWAAASPSGIEGLVVTGVPVAVTSSGLETVRPLEVSVPASTAVVARIGPLFPFQSGYSVAATTCAPLTPAVMTTSLPGATASATVPMGLLSIRVTDASGDPDTGATITAAPSCASTLSAPPGKTNPASYTLPTTGPLGLSQIALPYGTYTLSVTYSGHTWKGTVAVTATSLILTPVTHPVSRPVSTPVPVVVT